MPSKAGTTLTVTSRGQVTIRRDVLQHLGIRPGDKIKLDLLPDGRAELTADRPRGAWSDLRGALANKGNGAKLTLDELETAIRDAGVNSASRGLRK